MKTRIIPKDFDKVQKWLATLPDGLVNPVIRAFAYFYYGVFHEYNPPYKYVSRKRAGYTTSPAQIRFMFATGILESDGQGGIIFHPYERTAETQNAWRITESGKYKWSLVNASPGAYWTISDEGQTRQHKLMGKKTVSMIISENLKEGIQVIRDALMTAARSLQIK